jgi:hypothetical protein
MNVVKSFAADTPPVWEICGRNLFIVLPLYATLHVGLYVWKATMAHKYKFNKVYPPSSLVWKGAPFPTSLPHFCRHAVRGRGLTLLMVELCHYC